MKIAFLLPWNQDIAYWTQWADDNGIDGIELLYSSHDLPVPYEFKPEEIKRALEGKRVKICATTMFWINTISKDPEERKQARELNENTIKTASAIGCPYAVLGTGCYEPKNLEKNIEEFRKEYEYLMLGMELAQVGLWPMCHAPCTFMLLPSSTRYSYSLRNSSMFFSRFFGS